MLASSARVPPLDSEPAKADEGYRAVGWIGQALDRCDHIGRAQQPTVMKSNPAADLERPDAAVAIGLPAFGELRAQTQIGVGERQVFPGLRQHADAAGIGHRERIDRSGRHGHAHGHGAAGRAAAGRAAAGRARGAVPRAVRARSAAAPTGPARSRNAEIRGERCGRRAIHR